MDKLDRFHRFPLFFLAIHLNITGQTSLTREAQLFTNCKIIESCITDLSVSLDCNAFACRKLCDWMDLMLNKTLVPQSVARDIQNMIQSGQLTTGEKIPSQREFSQSLGISRASLREALLTLETLGLLKTEAGRGTFVTGTEPSSSNRMAPWRYSDIYSVYDVFQTRIMLEGRIAGLAAGRLTETQLEQMERATQRMEECWAMQDLLSNVEADLEFHSIIASSCSNAMLRALYQNVRDQLTETQRQPIPITEPKRMKASISEHRKIIAALRLTDGKLARSEMENHILNTARCAGLDP